MDMPTMDQTVDAPLPVPRPPIIEEASPRMMRPPVAQPMPVSPPPAQTVRLPSIEDMQAQQAQRKAQAQQKQEAEYLSQVYKQAKDVQSAAKDVAAARKVLAIMQMDRDVANGMTPQAAMFKNFSQMGQPGGAGMFNALRPPPPAPTMQNFQIPGTTNSVPAIVAPTRTGNQVHIVPRNALPPGPEETGAMQARPIMSAKGELLGYTVKTGPQTFSHKWLADMDGATKQQIKNNDLELREAMKELHATEKAGIASDGSWDAAVRAKPELQARHEAQKASIKKLQDDNIRLATKGGSAAQIPSATGSERVRVKSREGKAGSIPRSQLAEALKAGYSVMDAD